jgi:hypothetical protein
MPELREGSGGRDDKSQSTLSALAHGIANYPIDGTIGQAGTHILIEGGTQKRRRHTYICMTRKEKCNT